MVGDPKDRNGNIRIEVSASGGIAKRLALVIAVAFCVLVVRCASPEDAARILTILQEVKR